MKVFGTQEEQMRPGGGGSNTIYVDTIKWLYSFTTAYIIYTRNLKAKSKNLNQFYPADKTHLLPVFV